MNRKVHIAGVIAAFIGVSLIALSDYYFEFPIIDIGISEVVFYTTGAFVVWICGSKFVPLEQRADALEKYSAALEKRLYENQEQLRKLQAMQPWPI